MATYQINSGASISQSTYTVKEGPYNTPHEYRSTTRIFTKAEIEDLAKALREEETTTINRAQWLIGLCLVPLKPVLGGVFGTFCCFFNENFDTADKRITLLESLATAHNPIQSCTLEIIEEHKIVYNPDGSVSLDRWVKRGISIV